MRRLEHEQALVAKWGGGSVCDPFAGSGTTAAVKRLAQAELFAPPSVVLSENGQEALL